MVGQLKDMGTAWVT